MFANLTINNVVFAYLAIHNVCCKPDYKQRVFAYLTISNVCCKPGYKQRGFAHLTINNVCLHIWL